MNGRRNGYAKSIETGQPVQSAQADLCRNFLFSINLLHIKEPYKLMVAYFCREIRESYRDNFKKIFTKIPSFQEILSR